MVTKVNDDRTVTHFTSTHIPAEAVSYQPWRIVFPRSRRSIENRRVIGRWRESVTEYLNTHGAAVGTRTHRIANRSSRESIFLACYKER